MLRDERLTQFALLFVALAMVATYMFPVYWMYVTALKTGTEITAWPPSFWPANPDFAAVEVWQRMRMGTYLKNSAIIAVGVTAIVVVLGTGCGYALARVRSRWMDVALFSILMMQVLPSSLMITPIFVSFSQIGLLDYPRTSVILAQAAKVLPFYVVLTRATFAQVPRELEESALVEGNSRIGAFFSINVPLARNGILVAALLIFLQSLGEYVYSRSLIQSRALQPATVGLQSFMGPNTSDWQGVMTYAAIYVTPIILFFVFLQRQIVSGLTSGALK